ncbi:hypothetical protein JCM10908_003330 [Rhodotorula pacifica]|uniref:GNAT family N-acetyltransferase n=1 Tax=Rhodotorula pacifica TaxID=1495444 RepID=UPI00317416AD
MPTPCSFRSERLVYRALDFPADDAFLLSTVQDPATQMGYFGGVTKPYSMRDLESWKKHAESNILSVMICLAAEDGSAGQPVGVVDLEKREMGGPQNRCCGFGMVINKDFQGKGYATEAMEWILRRAFIGYNMHRVEGGVFSWNTAAFRTYQKVGFVEEGRRRKAVWEEGEWHDDVSISILAEEWFARHPDAVQQR